jgi:hypothetical protein
MVDVISPPGVDTVGMAPSMPDFNKFSAILSHGTNTNCNEPKRRDSGYAETLPLGMMHGSIHTSQEKPIDWKTTGFDVNVDETYFSHGSFGSIDSTSSFTSQLYSNEEQWQAQDEVINQQLPQRKPIEPRITEVVSPNRDELNTDSDVSPREVLRKRKLDQSAKFDEGPKSKVVAIRTTNDRTALNKAEQAKVNNRKAAVITTASSKPTNQLIKPGKTTTTNVAANKVTKPSTSRKTAITTATPNPATKKKALPPPPPSKRFQPTPRGQKQQSNTSSKIKPPTKRHQQKSAVRNVFEDDDDEIMIEEEDRDGSGNYGEKKKPLATNAARQRSLLQGGAKGKPIRIDDSE